MPGDYFGLSGHAIDGQFHAIEVAGEGGFSVVYRGMHLSMREPIAIKCLKIQIKSQNAEVVQSFTQRFFDESRIMYRLSQGNLNIVRAITTGVTVSPSLGETVPYMVLEWLDGVSLSKHMKDKRAKKEAPPSLKDVMALFEPAALAIAYAHSQGVVHRDVKPGNLFLQTTREGPRMKVLDFGMAKVLSPENMGGLESAETLANVMVVSPQYVTPEQLDKANGPIGPWTDVYAFALIVVEALTNRRAREAESFADLMIQITKDVNVPTPRTRGAQVNDAVEAVFKRALALAPSARQPDLGTFWRELKEAAERVVAPIAPAPVSMKVDSERTRLDVSAPVDFSKTMPLQSGRPSAAPEPVPRAQRPFAGTMPLRVAETSAMASAGGASASGAQPQDAPPPISRASAEGLRAAVATLDAARSSSPQVRPSNPAMVAPIAPVSKPVSSSSPASSPRSQHALVIPQAPEPSRTDSTARRPRPEPTPPVADAPRASRALVAFLLLFVLASLAATAVLFMLAFHVRVHI